MLYNQPLSTRFGTDFIAEIKHGNWAELDVAVAWVRRSALDHLAPHIKKFLETGAKARFVVGVDLLNTTREGLQSLLDLESSGDCSTFVYHNEAEGVFHPKVYLFRRQNDGKLIVGSNNLTGAGLFQNTEAGLSVEGPCSAKPVSDAIVALQTWTDTTSPLVLRLDLNVLGDLEKNGYVLSEAALKARHKKQRQSREKAKLGKNKMFGNLSVPRPAVPKPAAPASHGGTKSGTPTPAQSQPPTQTAQTGQILLMRPRLARGTQAQIPLRILGPFFKGQLHAKSVATNINRPISFTFPKQANGKKSTHPNTAKIELPEAAGMGNPVVRFVQNKSGGIEFEVWDEATPQGSSIMASLSSGLTLTPPQTFLTRPDNPNSSTWWRFI